MRTNKAIIRATLKTVVESTSRCFACLELEREGAKPEVVRAFREMFEFEGTQTFETKLLQDFELEYSPETAQEMRKLALAFFLAGYKDFL